MRIVAHSSLLRGAAAMKTSSTQLWTAHRTSVGGAFEPFGLSSSTALCSFPRLFRSSLRRRLSETSDNYRIITGYPSAILSQNARVTHVISETYDFFCCNSLRKIPNPGFSRKPTINTSLITVRFRRCLSYVDSVGDWTRVKLWVHAF
jgi:hypothetical protein